MRLKVLLVILLSAALVLQGCGTSVPAGDSNEALPADVEADIEFESLSDPSLTTYVEDAVYSQLIDELGDGDYFVENVEAKYVSKEYLNELSFNTQENIYFGYSLADLEAQFGDTKYVFTLGEDGQTVVTEFQAYDDSFDEVVRNVAIGAGVILVCATISVVTAGAGAPAAVSAVFAVSAKSAAAVGLSSGVISGAAAGIVSGVQSGDMEQAMQSAVTAGSEGFMWGAIGGAVAGGIGEGAGLFGASRNGLTMSQAAQIQKESKYPLDVIKQFKSVDEYQVYKNAGLRTQIVSGKTALVRDDIDLNFKSTLAGKEVTNLDRMRQGVAPIDSVTGESFQLHHINQDADGTLAILNKADHFDNYGVLHKKGMSKDISDNLWNWQRRQFWKDFAASFER